MTSWANLRGMAMGALLAGAVLVPIMYLRQGEMNREVGLERDAKEAAQDTTRRFKLAFNVLADGAIVSQRRIVQQGIGADKVDRALGVTSTSKGAISIQLPPITMLATTPTKDDVGGVRLLEFRNVRDTVGAAVISADITVPPAPQPATGVFHIAMNPIALNFRLSCGAKKRENNDVRPAHMEIFGPEYLRITMADLQQEPDVCNPKERKWLTDWRTLGLVGLLLVAGLRQ